MVLGTASAWAQPAEMYDIARQHFQEFQKRFQVKSSEVTTMNRDVISLRKKVVADYYDKAIKDILQQKQSNAGNVKDTLERFIKSYPNQGDLTAHALLVLGEQYFIASEAKFLENDDSDNKKQAELPNFSEAINIYTKLIAEFPGYLFIDIAYYLLGVCYSYEERSKEALHVWNQLVERFPKSLLNDEIWFRLGEEKFSQRDFKGAAVHYQKITDSNSNFYEKALYKLAWAYYVLNQFDEAIKGFTKVLDFQNDQTLKNNQFVSVLTSESEQYLAISFADKNENESRNQFSEEAIEQGIASLEMLKAYFREIGRRPYERNVTIALSEVLFKLAKSKGAEQALLYAISLDPFHPQNPDLNYRIVKFYDEAGMLEQAMGARQAMFAQYSPESDWNKAMQAKGQKQVLLHTRSLLNEALLKLAFYEHAKARQKATENKSAEAVALFQAATTSYVTYVQLYPEQNDIDKILFFLGEAAFDAQWFEDAGYAFALVRDWPWQTEYRQKAALNSVFAYRRNIEIQQQNNNVPQFDLATIQTKNKGQLAPPLLPAFEKLIDAVDKLAFTYPKEENLASFLFESAGIYYSYGDINEANKRFMKIISLFPGLEVARLSANLILEDKLANGLWAEAASEAAKFQTAKIGNSSAEFRRIAVSARFKEAEKNYETANLLLKEGQSEKAEIEFAQSAQLYLALLHDDPKSEFADKILFNMAMAFSLSKQSDEASKIFERIYREFPKSDLSKEAMLKSAVYFEQSLQFHKAAETYLLISYSYPQSEQAGDALLNAALFFELDEDRKKAASAFHEFHQRYPNRPEAGDALMRATRLNDKLNAFKGQAQFAGLEKDFARFKATKINGMTGKKQSQQLIDKTKQLTELKKKYERIALQFKDSKWSLAALYQIGALYEGLFQALLKAPCPSDVAAVDDSACDEYSSILEDKAFVLEEKAVSAFLFVKNNSAKGIGEDDEWSLRAEDALHRLRPSEYAVADRPLIVMAVSAACPHLADNAEEESAAYATLRKNPRDITARLSIAHLYYRQSKYQAARMILQDALAMDDKNACLHLWFGHILSHQKEWTDAIASYEKAIVLDPLGSRDLYLSLGNAYFMNKQYEKAKVSYEKELQADKKTVQVYFNLGLLYLNGEFPHLEALAHLTLAQNYFVKYLDSGHPDAGLKMRVGGYLTMLQQKIEIEKQKKATALKGDGN